MHELKHKINKIESEIYPKFLLLECKNVSYLNTHTQTQNKIGDIKTFSSFNLRDAKTLITLAFKHRHKINVELENNLKSHVLTCEITTTSVTHTTHIKLQHKRMQIGLFTHSGWFLR